MSCSRFSYKRLKQEEADHDDEFQLRDFYEKAVSIRSNNSWHRLRRVSIKKRLKLKTISALRLKKFVVIRKKLKLVSSVRVSISNIVKRLRESQSHLGDLFAGNYLFLQVTPSFKSNHIDNNYNNFNFNNYCNNYYYYNNGLKYSLPRIAH